MIRKKFIGIGSIFFLAIITLQVLAMPFMPDTYALNTYPRISALSESDMSKVLYIAAIELCMDIRNTANDVGGAGLNDVVTIGESITTILAHPDAEVFIGPIAEGTGLKSNPGTYEKKYNGYIKCKDALTRLVGDIKITADMITGSKTNILTNVYSQRPGLTESVLTCNYYVLNWGDNGHSTGAVEDKIYHWPQGVVGDSRSNPIPPEDNHLNDSPIRVYFNDEGFVKIEREDGSRTADDEFISEQIAYGLSWRESPNKTKSDGIFKDDDASKYCERLVNDIDTFGVEKTMHNNQWSYKGGKINYNKDYDPFDHSGTRQGYSAWLYYDSDKVYSNSRYSTAENAEITELYRGYTYTIRKPDSSSTSSQYELKGGASASSTLMGNIRELFYALLTTHSTSEMRSMTAWDYIHTKDGLAYMFYGRYLFNGDGAFSYDSASGSGGCGAQTILNSDDLALQPDWDPDNAFISEIKAYAGWDDDTKTDYMSSWAGSNNSSALSIPITPAQTHNSASATVTDCKEIASKFNGVSVSESVTTRNRVLGYMGIKVVTEPGVDPTVPVTPDPVGEDQPPADTCNAGVLGWILCPVIEILGSALDGLYTLIIEPFLVIQADLVPQSGGTFDAWNTFRSMANVIFIIFILVVAFSQITGIGVTNYGIKKILPKIIICALLVNLSYYICQLAVDISNILGNQLHEMLSKFGGGLTYINPSNDTVVEASAIWATLGGIAAVGIGGIAVAASIGTILIALLAGLVSLLMMFLILAARKVAVVVLIALSPLAFVCFLLPNTEKLFKKWFDILKTMLLVYPICGLLIGAGHMAASIISKIDHQFFTQLAGALASILPYFFVPTLIKGSLNAFGSVGAKLSGLTGRISKGTRDRLDSSTLGKAASARDTAFKNKRLLSDKSLRNKTLGSLYGSKFGKRFGLDKAYSGVQAGAVAGQKRAEKEEFDAQMMLLASQTNNGDLGMLRKEYNMALKSGDETRARAALELAGSQGPYGAGQASKWVKEDSVTTFKNNPSMRNAVAKQIATGASSANFRKADAMTWQYANAVNSGAKTKAENELLPDKNWYDGVTELNTKGSDNKNITSAGQLKAVVSDGRALQDLSNDALKSIISMSPNEINHYKSIAEEAYRLYEKGTFQLDATKAKSLNDILNYGNPNYGNSKYGENPGDRLFR